MLVNVNVSVFVHDKSGCKLGKECNLNSFKSNECTGSIDEHVYEDEDEHDHGLARSRFSTITVCKLKCISKSKKNGWI